MVFRQEQKNPTGHFQSFAVAYLLYCCANFTILTYIISSPKCAKPTDLILQAFVA